jgi:gamma-glutamylcyclotransferase (GGCT)/AIG2-like uncharacterized protein YtfP
MLHFAYGSNMSPALMRARCPGATALGPAALGGWTFLVTADRYASIVPRPGGVVHGVIWRIGPRDLAALNAYESLDSGLYRRRMLSVRYAAQTRRALVFLGRTGDRGQPNPEYLDEIARAARYWNLPPSYTRALARWSPSRWHGARRVDTGEIGEIG